MRSSAIIILSLIAPDLVLAVSHREWDYGDRDGRVNDEIKAGARDLDLAAYKLQQRFHSGSQDTTVGCQEAINSVMTSSCSTRDDGKPLEERHRSAVAISFTICSMISAYQPIPAECTPWEPKQGRNNVISPNPASEVQMRQCLAVLHRSPQDWNSYQGYLKEATQLCLALDGRRQARVAQQTYLNATLEKLSFLDLIKRNEARREVEAKKFQADIEQHLVALRSATRMAESILDGFSTHAERQLVMSDRFNDMLSALQSTGIDLMQQIDEQASRRATDVISAMGDGLQRIKLQFSSEFSAELKAILGAHDRDVDDHFTALDLAIHSVGLSATEQITELIKYTSDHRKKLKSSSDDLAITIQHSHDGVASMGMIMQDLQDLLAVSYEQMRSLSTLQNQTTGSMRANLGFSQRISAELQQTSSHVNDTIAVLEQLRQEASVRSWWTRQTSFSLFSPSLISSRWLENTMTPKSIVLALQILSWCGNALISAALLGLYGVISILASVWLLFRTRLWKLTRILRHTVWTEIATALDVSADDISRLASAGIKSRAPARSYRKPPAAAFDVPPGQLLPDLPQALALNTNEAPVFESQGPLALQRSYGSLMGQHRRNLTRDRRAVSMPP